MIPSYPSTSLCIPSRSSESLSKLHDLADTLESHLSAAELLSSYGVNLTPCHLRDMQGDTARVGEVLTKVTRTAAKRCACVCNSPSVWSYVRLTVASCLAPQNELWSSVAFLWVHLGSNTLHTLFLQAGHVCAFMCWCIFTFYSVSCDTFKGVQVMGSCPLAPVSQI